MPDELNKENDILRLKSHSYKNLNKLKLSLHPL